jgi:transaldolase
MALQQTFVDGQRGHYRKNNLKHYVDICNLVDGDVSAEVNALDYDGMKRGEELADLHEQIVVKLPMTKEGVMAAKYFSDKGIKTNVTLVFSAGQALAAKGCYLRFSIYWSFG